MGLLSGATDAIRRRGSDASHTSGPPGSPDRGQAPDGKPDDVEILDKEEGSVLSAMISQLRIGMDLSKITFPTFVLEPRSMLERITDFMAHPELMFKAGQIQDPKQRLLQVTALILAGWHIKPKGVKKPYNPVLGEFFRCTYTYEDGSEGFFIAEQVSHHPPISAFFYTSPQNGIVVTGELKPKSKFLGNSVATIMEGENRVRLLDRPEDGEYTLTMPNMFARGILFGKMMLELGDSTAVTCPATHYSCDIEWKTKGWISGGYNAIAGHVRGPEGSAGEITGHWDGLMEFKDKGGKKQTLFDATRAQVRPKTVLPEDQQEANESRRQWADLTAAIKASDMDAATEAKAKVEDGQREMARRRESSGQTHQQRFFQPVGDKWMPKLNLDQLSKDPAELLRAVKEFIFADSSTAQQPPPATSRPARSNTGASEASGLSAQNQPISPVDSSRHATTASIASQDSFASATSDLPIRETAPGPPAGPLMTHPPTQY